MKFCVSQLLLLAFAIACAGGRVADPASRSIVSEELRIPAADAGIELYLRNKHPAALDPAKIVLFVHGGGWGGEATFDLQLDGTSWLDYVAAHGWDAWLVDVRGHGASTKPPEMARPAAENPPIVRTDVALRDVGSATELILKRRGASRIALIGWSWGAAIVGTFATRHRESLSRLVLGAPGWLRSGPVDTTPLGAYLMMEPRFSVERAQRNVPPEKKAGLMPAAWIAQFEAAALAGDPEGAKQTPPVVRYPSGMVQDGREYWAAGKPYYDPSQIDVPVLVIHAEWDAMLPSSLARAVFDHLTNAPRRRFVEVGEGTHFVFLEKNRFQVFREVQLFLDEPARP